MKTDRIVFADRADAGRRLAAAVAPALGEQSGGSGRPLVLAIPRGGVEVGFAVARKLNADLAIVICRKLPFPDNPESGFGAIAEDGSVYLHPEASPWVPAATVAGIIAEQQAEIRRRIKILRRGEPLPPLAGRTVILVDDGLAMGSTMRAAIALCRKAKAGRIVAAVPVSSHDVAVAIKRLADEVVILDTPPGFRAVADSYAHWYDVADDEVLRILGQ